MRCSCPHQNHAEIVMNRRTLLKSALYSAPLFTAGRLYAAPAAGPRILVVFLRGAYDAANILVRSAATFTMRRAPNIAIPGTRPCPWTSDWGLHPALKDTILGLCGKTRKSPSSPSPAPTMSRARISKPRPPSSWASPCHRNLAAAAATIRSGFLSTHRASLSGAKPISFTTQLPLTFRGGASVPNIALNLRTNRLSGNATRP